jgi:hypothetical protein
MNRSSTPWSGDTHHRQQRRNSNRPFLLTRSCAQCFKTEKRFCLWNSCCKAQQTMQVSNATDLRNCVMRSRTSDVACLVRVLFCFMTMPTHTLTPQCKISLWHLARNNSIIPPTAQTQYQVIFMCSCICKLSLVAGGSTTTRSKKPLTSHCTDSPWK